MSMVDPGLGNTLPGALESIRRLRQDVNELRNRRVPGQQAPDDPASTTMPWARIMQPDEDNWNQSGGWIDADIVDAATEFGPRWSFDMTVDSDQDAAAGGYFASTRSFDNNADTGYMDDEWDAASDESVMYWDYEAYAPDVANALAYWQQYLIAASDNSGAAQIDLFADGDVPAGEIILSCDGGGDAGNLLNPHYEDGLGSQILIKTQFLAGSPQTKSPFVISDTIGLGGTVWFKIRPEGDAEWPIDTTGPILTDRTTSTQYRLLVNGGVLSIEVA